jgi:tetrathionate reductase subunit B
MDKTRRGFLTRLATVSLGSAAVVPQIAQASLNEQPPRQGGDASKRWAMVIDMTKCIGCQSCTISCTIENQSPVGQFRTVVNQYEVKTDTNEGVAQMMMPRLCNHCDEPPCVPVCPVQATYQHKDGIVVVDSDRCVGCGYCVQACPYDARFINEETNTADKCTFCTHRLDAGLLPACVESCVGGARMIGDIKDDKSLVSQLLAANKEDIKVIKPEMNTKPHVFYIGLDEAFISQVDGQVSLWSPDEEDDL